VLTVQGTPVAELAVVKVGGDGSSVPARLKSRQTSGAKVTETWSLADQAIDVVLDYASVPAPPATKINLKAINRTAAKAAACVAVELRLKYPVNRAILFDFTKAPYVELAYHKDGMTSLSPRGEKDLNFQNGLYGFPNRRTIYNAWGTTDLCNPPDAKTPFRRSGVPAAKEGTTAMHSTLYLPIISLGDADKGGLVAWCDPRTPTGFDGNRERLRLQHTFYLPARKGAVDDGFEPGDGTGPWPYMVYLAYAKKPTWDLLYSTYLATAPDLRGGTKSRFEAGIINLMDPRREGVLPLCKRLGIKYTGALSVSTSDPDDITPEGIAVVKRHGVSVCAHDGTIGMAIELDKSPVPPFEPQWAVERYKSSLIKDKAGKKQGCWNGKFANPSPRFPFGRDRLQAVKELLRLPVGGFYIDLFLSTAAADWAHPTDALPFYPMQRAYYEYLSAVAQETRKRGQLFIINAPHPSCLVGKYADVMTFDTDMPIWLMGRAYGDLTGISVQFWTNLQDSVPKLKKSMSDALAYGVITGPYVQGNYLLPDSSQLRPDQKEAMLKLYERHYRLAYEIGRARLVKGSSTDGRPGPFLYYRGRNGTGYVTVQNLAEKTKEFEVPLELQALGLDKAAGLSRVLWDINSGMGGAKRLEGQVSSIKLPVEPGLTSVIVLKPQAR